MATQIPMLPEIERLSPSVIRILGGNPSKFTLQGTNTYLLGTGPSRLLVDTGEGLTSWRNLLGTVLASEHATISYALLTHWHHDHVGGVKDLLALCPEAEIRKYNPEPSQALIHDGQVFQAEGATVKALHCPGHTTDHVALILSEEGAMFTGDNVLGHGTAVFESLSTYLSSLALMLQHCPPGRAYPGHGAVIEDGRAKIEEYITHRKEREEEILRALGSGVGTEKTVMEIVKVVYKDYPENLHMPAANGVTQVLKKLEEEGKVSQSRNESWMIASKATL